jgi:ribonuclease HI
MDAVIFSDGGSDSSGHAGAACIVEVGSQAFRFIAYLGKATNNEGEIFAGLIGFIFLNCLAEQKGSAVKKIRWIADSQYVLQSATGYIFNWQRNGWKTASKEPVKNQGLWRTYLAVSKPFSVVPEHVKGHSGHLENEACDRAVRFAREEGASTRTNGLVKVELPCDPPFDEWLFFDGRPALELLRGELPDNQALPKLSKLIAPAISAGSTIEVSALEEDSASSFKEAVKSLVAEHKGRLKIGTTDHGLLLEIEALLRKS